MPESTQVLLTIAITFVISVFATVVIYLTRGKK